MSLTRYPEYKDSGVAWLGEVPQHWEVAPYKHFVDIHNGADHKKIEQADGFPVIGSGGPFAFASEFLYDGESVLLGRKGTIDKPLYIVGKFWTVDTMYWTKISPDAFGKFAYYVALTIPFTYYSTNTALPSMTKGALSAHAIARPPLDEQTAIATFLDRETAKIDGLIAEQEKLIALLAEKRQATISHAVTKGLNPDVRMKDSGVAWLGEVPAHWFLGQLKNFIRQKPGAIKTGPFGSHLTSAEMQEGIVKVYNQRSVIDNNFIDGENYISQEKFEQLSSFQAFPGDVLVTTRGTIGRAAILPGNADLGILHPCLLRVQVDEKKLHREFLVALIQGSHLMKTQIALSSNATTIEVIYSETMASLFIPLPPLAEQKAILLFLDSETARLDALTAAATHGIALLKERRSALISAAVTGKIDVRAANNQ